MIKKLLFLLLILSTLSIYNNSFALTDKNIKTKYDLKKTTYEITSERVDEAQKKIDSIQKEVNNTSIENNNYNTKLAELSNAKKNLDTAKESLNTASAEYSQATNEYKQTETYKNSPEGKQDISSRWFEVEVWKVTPWNNLGITSWTKTTEVLNMTLWNLIQKLMIGLWSVSLLIMTFWGWYMVIYHGQDELLSKWKWMFTSGIIALIVSLSSYYMVDLLRFILYS